MSRSGYVEDGDDELMQLWRGAVERAIGGKRGQAFLREMAAALDAMPVKELIFGDIVRENGQVCALGAVAVARHMDVLKLDAEDGEDVGKAFGIARTMACEIAYVNDDEPSESPEKRWRRVRAWVDRKLKP